MKKIILITLLIVFLISGCSDDLQELEKVEKINLQAWIEDIESNPKIDITYEEVKGEEKAFIHQDNLIVSFENVKSELTKQEFIVTIKQSPTVSERRTVNMDFFLSTLDYDENLGDVEIYDLKGNRILEGEYELPIEEELKYKVIIKTPIEQREDGSYGSQGILHLNLDDNQFEDLTHSSWWNGGCYFRKKVTYTNPDTYEHTFELLTYDLYNDTDWNTNKNSSADFHVINSSEEEVVIDIYEYNNGSNTLTKVDWIHSSIGASSTDEFFMYYGCTSVSEINKSLFDFRDPFENITAENLGDGKASYRSDYWTPTASVGVNNDSTYIREGDHSFLVKDANAYINSTALWATPIMITWWQYSNSVQEEIMGISSAGGPFGIRGPQFNTFPSGNWLTHRSGNEDESNILVTTGWHYLKVVAYENNTLDYFVDNEFIQTVGVAHIITSHKLGHLSGDSQGIGYFDDYKIMNGTTNFTTLQLNGYHNRSSYTFIAQGSLEIDYPLVEIFSPLNNSQVVIPFNITFNATDSMGSTEDSINVSLMLNQSATETLMLVSDLNQNNESYLINTGIAKGLYNLTLLACELETADLLCNSTFVNSIEIVNNEPTITNIKLNATNDANFTIYDLLGSFTPNDFDAGDSLTYDIKWYKNNISQFTYSEVSATNGTRIITQLDYENTTTNDLWNCEIRLYDQTNYSAWTNSSQLKILEPTLMYQVNQTYNSSVEEGTLQIFVINITFYDWWVKDIKSIFEYNGTARDVIKTEETDNRTSFQSTFTIPMGSATHSFSWNLTLVLENGTTIYNNSYVGTQTTTESILYQCNGSNESSALVLNYTLRHEENDTLQTGDVSANFVLYKSVVSINKTVNIGILEDIVNFSLCIHPKNASFIIDGQIQYSGPDGTRYDPRDYYYRNYSLDNITDNVGLYLLDISKATGITFTVTDPDDIEIDNVIIDVQRYNVGNNTLKTIAMGKTNTDGKDLIYLRKNDVFYTIRIIQLDGTINIFSNQKIIDDEVFIKISSNELKDLFETYENTVGEILLNDRTFTAYFNDSSDTLLKGCFRIQKVNLLGNEFVYDECISGSNGNFVHTVDNSSSIFLSSLTIGINPTFPLRNRVDDFKASGLFDNMGIFGAVFLATLIMLAVIGAGLWSPAIAVFMSLFCMIMFFAMGLIPLAYSTIIAFVIAAGMLINKLKE